MFEKVVGTDTTSIMPSSDLAPANRGMADFPSLGRPSAENPEDDVLYMPSQVSVGLRTVGLAADLCRVELRLRLAVMEETLHHLRRQIRLRSALVRDKRVHFDGPGQVQMTRVRGIIAGVSTKINANVERYRRSRKAALLLDSDGDWKQRFSELKDTDIKPPTKEENELGVGYHELGWIWRVQRMDERDVTSSKSKPLTDADIHDSK
jgi:hypothetical protein